MADTPQDAADRRLLGVGLSFPLRMNASGYMATSQGKQLVREAIEQLIMTDPLERPYRVRNGIQYGTRIRRLLFEDLEQAKAIAVPDIRQALQVWEPRIILLGVTLDNVNDPTSSVTGISVSIKYRIKATGDEDFHVVNVVKEAQP